MVLIGLGVWIVALLMVSLWFQDQYVKAFTEETTFLQPSQTQAWFDELTPLLLHKNASHRLVQFWHPDCLCNRFAREHALKAIDSSTANNVEHITIIPKRFESQLSELQTRNPDTKIITLAKASMSSWPSSPAVLLENAQQQVQYFGPLGFGAFCSQASTSFIDRQIQQISSSQSTVQPHFNVIGQGCFCPWG